MFVALLCCLLQSGCLTSKVLSRSQEKRQLEFARLEVVEAGPTSIRLAWQTRYEGARSRSGVIEFDPQLTGCDEVNVSMHRDGEPRGESEGSEVVSIDESTRGAWPGFCDVVILIATPSEDVAVRASHDEQALGEATIRAPRNHLWLAVVPLAAAADAVAAVSVVSFGVALVALDSMGHGETATTWTWKP